MNKNFSNNQGFGHVGLLAIIVVVAAVGFAGYRVINNEDDSTNLSVDTTSEAQLAETLPSDLSGLKTIDEIYSLVEAQNTGTEIAGVELEIEDGQPVYVVHFQDGTVVAFDATTGAVVQHNDDGDDEIEDDELLPSGFVAGISIQDAINIAANNRPNSTLEKVELEVEDGVVVYSVRFTDDSRVDVNAASGTVQRLKDETGEDIIKVDDDFDDDGIDNPEDDDDDNDGTMDDEDPDDDNDNIDDAEDNDDDNDGLDDDEDDDDDEGDEDSDNSGSGNNN